ncbi:MAG TPA: DUF3810 family protein [Candidatus Tumulicola sp.]|jgi:hypothetical protein
MGGSFLLVLRLLAIVAGVAALAWQPDASWIERAYSNGGYSQWEHVAFAITNPIPWSAGDIATLIGAAGAIWCIAIAVRAPRAKRFRAIGSLVLSLAAIAGAYAVWFEASWGWNYARAPIESRVRFDPSRITTAAAERLRAIAVEHMNRLAPAAHALAAQPLDLAKLRASWLPAVRSGGDDWDPNVGSAKPTIANPFMMATGTSGFINPFALTVQISSDVLWFERPFDQAHEWSHVAAYAREDEANYLAIVTCLRSHDPAIQYSGWFELFLYLPQKTTYAKSDFNSLVWQDFAAMRKRNAHNVNVLLSRWTWKTYNAYLKTNRIASGIENYNEVTRLVLGVPLDANGLPVPVSGGAPPV